jgi:serine/threonine protein kinase
VAGCFNPRIHHDNPSGVVSCQHCDFLVQGAQIDTYEVIDFIGTGSYGHVYKVREPNPLERTLALKVLRLDQASARHSFFQEARRIANMQHTNILPIYNFGLVSGSQQPYFVMEYAPQTINDLFRRTKNASNNGQGTRRLAFAEELVPYIHQTANALNYVHDNGFVHQDVKPANLLIGRNGQILLADFGTVYYLGMQTHASLGEITGTAAYMPPEQWQGAPRRDSDQYALAICCYELLSGRTPFVYRQLDAMFQAHLKEPPQPPQHWNSRIPSEVSAVLLRALTKDYRQRYPSIIDFAEQYSHAVEVAQQRYLCQICGQQNRTGAQRCAFCGTEDDGRFCQHCGHQVRFGQRCCSRCGRLTISPNGLQYHPLVGVTMYQGRYTLQRVLKQNDNTGTMVAQANDERNPQQPVVIKRWECRRMPLAQRASDIAYYERATEPLARLRHPLLPRILDRFAEGQYYYAVMTYIDGETLEERLQRILRPIPEREGIHSLNALLNILIALERLQPPLRHYDISPANILIEYQRGRVFLTGLQVPPPPLPPGALILQGGRTTRKLAISPYQPIQDRPYDQRTCIYALAATMHHALTNTAPPHYPAYPPVRLLNPAVSPDLEYILSRALLEDPAGRYQNYTAMQKEVQRLL